MVMDRAVLRELMRRVRRSGLFARVQRVVRVSVDERGDGQQQRRGCQQQTQELQRQWQSGEYGDGESRPPHASVRCCEVRLSGIGWRISDQRRRRRWMRCDEQGAGATALHCTTDHTVRSLCRIPTLEQRHTQPQSSVLTAAATRRSTLVDHCACRSSANVPQPCKRSHWTSTLLRELIPRPCPRCRASHQAARQHRTPVPRSPVPAAAPLPLPLPLPHSLLRQR